MKKTIAHDNSGNSIEYYIVAAIVLTILIVGFMAVTNVAVQKDSLTLTTGFILLFAATASGVMNYFRSKKTALRMAANSLAVELHEKALLEHTIVNVTSSDGKILAVNEKFTETFGYTADEIVGKPSCLLYRHGCDTAQNEELMETVFSGQAWSGSQRLVSKSGQCVMVQASIFPKVNEFGEVTGFVSIRTDLSKAIAESVETGRNSVVDDLPDGVFIYDPESFEINYGNASFRQRVGWASDDHAAKSVTSLFSDDDLKLFRRYLVPLINGETRRAVFEFSHASGPVEVLTHFVEDVDGKRRLVSVVRDISARKQAEQLKLSSVSTVSHELRTPLTSIKGALRLLESGVMGDLTPDVSKLVGVAHRNSERLLAIVNDILTLEELHFGKMAIRAKDVDLRDILNEAAEAIAPFAAECEVKFVVETTSKPALVQADPDRLMQVMSNLMSNAAKFSPVGSGIILRLEDQDSAWRVCVEDKGPGIPEHARSTLFDSFIQVENTPGKAFPSTGLGLTICREIIQKHGGRIAFDTEVGRGTTFYFDLEKSAPLKQTGKLSAVA
ncbi:PAS domain-containing sensor histidine kinase [uncultured Marivita sp.]|uniref:PAS domain-containing sensor histidine kinase n=1 Tax=uncultured Marivita sp. TaxID=888080 RepID=UPI002613E181|nr:PAS domain-containing sensor histidine kinase [uncultured Marivita sp.]